MPVDLFTKDKTDHIIIQHGDSILKVYYFGANITSWKYRGVERLFLSSKAIVTGPKAIRGGIPIVFPQFGPEALPGYKALPQHGFARYVQGFLRLK
jgi:glucose-6-phosphate 1-epimerase